jgi:hypothetical protein
MKGRRDGVWERIRTLNWKCFPSKLEKPTKVYSNASLSISPTTVDSHPTDCFPVSRTTLTGKAKWHARGLTTLLVVASDYVGADDENIHLAQFDCTAVPCGLDSLSMLVVKIEAICCFG